MSSGGTLILNSDDSNVRKINTNKYEGKIITFGLHSRAHFRASRVKYVENGMSFTISHSVEGETIHYPAYVPSIGIHNAYNALAAIAIVSEYLPNIILSQQKGTMQWD